METLSMLGERVKGRKQKPKMVENTEREERVGGEGEADERVMNGGILETEEEREEGGKSKGEKMNEDMFTRKLREEEVDGGTGTSETRRGTLKTTTT